MQRTTTACLALLFGTAAPSLATSPETRAPVGPGGAGDEQHAIMYFKDRIPLTLAPDRIAVRLREAAVPQLVLDRHGLTKVASSPVHAGWHDTVIPVDARGDEPATARAALLDDDDVQFVSPVFLDDHGGPMLITDETFIQFAANVTPAAAEAILAAAGFETILERDYRGVSNVYHVRSSARDGAAVLAATNELAERADVVFAEPDRIIRVYPAGIFVPDDPEFGNCWGLHNIGQFVNGWIGNEDVDMNVPDTWIHEDGDANIIVAVLDNGIQQDHPDINQVTPGYDMTDLAFIGQQGGPVLAFDNHGTPVASCISGVMNNGIGSLGVAPGARTISVKIAYDGDASPGWTSQSSWIADGVLETLSIGARITNSSFTAPLSSIVTVAYDSTYSSGVMHFASTGNGGDDDIGDPTISYPASIGSTNAIAAITPLGDLTSFSNYGTGVHFAAPGTSVRVADRTGADGYTAGDVMWFGGTSAASPYAAGVAALAMSSDNALTPVTCGVLMASTAKDLGAPGYDIEFGFGLPDAHAAIIDILFEDDCGGVGSCLAPTGLPGCSDSACCAMVCDLDPFCCGAWDAACVELAAVNCYGCGTAGTGDCFSSNGTPSCSEGDCCAAVCAIDPLCCTDEWDSGCALIAFDICGPANDVCVNATPVGEGAHSFSTVDAHAESVSPIECGDFGPDVWYRFVADCTGNLLVSTCNTATFDTMIAVYEVGLLGSYCPGSTFGAEYLACNDDAQGCDGGSSVLIPAESGEEYVIRIGGGIGSGTFTVSCGVPGDICGLAMPASEGPNPFSTIGANTDGAEHASCGFCCDDDQIWSDVWFTYVAPCTGELTASTCNDADFDTKLAVYTTATTIGYVCNFGVPQQLLGCNDDAIGCSFGSSVTIDVEADRVYRIRVGGFDGAEGTGTLTLACAPQGTCASDIDVDGVVGVGDLLALLGAWGFCPNCRPDLNSDNVVDVEDLLIVLGDWGTTCP